MVVGLIDALHVFWQDPPGNNNSDGSTHARQYPLSYIISGAYNWYDGKLVNQNMYGYWWSATLNIDYYTGQNNNAPQGGAGGTNGFAL